MATLTTQVVSDTGLEATYDTAAAGGDQCATGTGVLLHVKNADASSHTVTLASPQVHRGDLAVDNRDVIVPAGEDRFIAVPDFYRGSDGLCSITYDAVTSVTVAVLRV